MDLKICISPKQGQALLNFKYKTLSGNPELYRSALSDYFSVSKLLTDSERELALTYWDDAVKPNGDKEKFNKFISQIIHRFVV